MGWDNTLPIILFPSITAIHADWAELHLIKLHELLIQQSTMFLCKYLVIANLLKECKLLIMSKDTASAGIKLSMLVTAQRCNREHGVRQVDVSSN